MSPCFKSVTQLNVNLIEHLLRQTPHLKCASKCGLSCFVKTHFECFSIQMSVKEFQAVIALKMSFFKRLFL